MRGRPSRDTGALLLDHIPDDAKNMYKLVEVRHALPPPSQCPGCHGGEGDYNYPPQEANTNTTSSKIGVCEPIQMYDPHQYERFEGGGKVGTGVSTGSGQNGGQQQNNDEGTTPAATENVGNQENNHNSLVEQQQQELQRQIQQQPIPPEEDLLDEDGNLPPGAVVCECANCHSCTLESPYTIDNWKPQDVYRSVARRNTAGTTAEPPDVTQHGHYSFRRGSWFRFRTYTGK